MKWFYISSDTKVAKYTGNNDVRKFKLRGHNTFADYTDIDPRNGRQLDQSEWFVFAQRKEYAA